MTEPHPTPPSSLYWFLFFFSFILGLAAAESSFITFGQKKEKEKGERPAAGASTSSISFCLSFPPGASCPPLSCRRSWLLLQHSRRLQSRKLQSLSYSSQQTSCPSSTSSSFSFSTTPSFLFLFLFFAPSLTSFGTTSPFELSAAAATADPPESLNNVCRLSGKRSVEEEEEEEKAPNSWANREQVKRQLKASREPCVGRPRCILN